MLTADLFSVEVHDAEGKVTITSNEKFVDVLLKRNPRKSQEIIDWYEGLRAGELMDGEPMNLKPMKFKRGEAENDPLLQ